MAGFITIILTTRVPSSTARSNSKYARPLLPTRALRLSSAPRASPGRQYMRVVASRLVSLWKELIGKLSLYHSTGSRTIGHLIQASATQRIQVAVSMFAAPQLILILPYCKVPIVDHCSGCVGGRLSGRFPPGAAMDWRWKHGRTCVQVLRILLPRC